MADNTQLNQNVSSGNVIATEDIGNGVQAQRVKLIVGAQHTDGGDVSTTNQMPVDVYNVAGSQVNPSSDDVIMLLRRHVDIFEPLSIQDSNNRQKVCIDSITGALTLATITSVGTVTTVTTVSTVTTCSTVTNVSQLGGYPIQWNLIDQARNAYANGIRRSLAFS